MPEWVEYSFDVPQVVAAYEIAARPDSYVVYDSPVDFTLQASSGGGQFTIVDSQTGVDDWVAHSSKRFYVSSPTAFSTYRLDVTATGGRSNGEEWLVLCELTFYGVAQAPSDPNPRFKKHRNLDFGVS